MMAEVKVSRNLIEKIGNLPEGDMSPDEVEQALQDLTSTEKPKNRVDEFVVPIIAERPLNRDELHNVRNLTRFFKEMSLALQDEFIRMMIEYQFDGGRTGASLIKMMHETGLDKPSFRLYLGSSRSNLLERLRVRPNWQFQENSVAVVFNLPKPLAQYWNKGKAKTEGSSGMEVNGMVIEWGIFYRGLLETFWQELGKYEKEEGYRFFRINPRFNHNPSQYYYIWEAGYQLIPNGQERDYDEQ